MSDIEPGQVLTWGAIALLAVPRLVEAVKWFLSREVKRVEEEKKITDDRLSKNDLRLGTVETELINVAKRVEAVREAGERNHLALQRDFTDLQKSNGGLLDAVRALDTSVAERLERLEIQMRQEITRAMREAVNEGQNSMRARPTVPGKRR